MLNRIKKLFSAVETQGELDRLQLQVIQMYGLFTTLAHKPCNVKLTVNERSKHTFVFKVIISIVYLIGTWYRLFLTYDNLYVSQLMHAILFNFGISGHIPILMETFQKRWEISQLFNSFSEFEKLQSGKLTISYFLCQKFFPENIIIALSLKNCR